ncbi:hypothetical protein C8R46DRAFT_1050804 [Mycena filopes]|nr:hypothetical protein C8R46DRAFT_1050804 [Mycena filopes]
MPRGRPALDPEIKAQHRRESLQRYAAKNSERLRLAARSRMQKVRAFNAEIVVSQGYTPKHRLAARASSAKYRERRYLKEHGAEALDEQIERPHMTRTQKHHEGRPPPPRPSPPTENQHRCRALCAMGLEEDNSEDSDEELPDGVCGCNLSECQRPHRNETARRKDWKRFHLMYDDDGNLR